MLVSNCEKTQKVCKKAVGACPFMLDCVPDCYKMKEMCEKAVSKGLFYVEILSR